LVVDNASTDETLARSSIKYARVVRHSENQGTSGTVYTGMQFALENSYDWIWVFDADSNPEPDALEKLLDCHAGLPKEAKDRAAYVACVHRNVQDGLEQRAGVFTRRGFRPASHHLDDLYYPCHVVIWSGCLYRLATIQKIGLPNRDYVLDWGEGEYGYRIMKAGYTGFVCRQALMYHNSRGYTSIRSKNIKFGPLTVRVREFAPIRCYYTCRNQIYFSLHEAAEARFFYFLNAVRWVLPLTLNFVLRPRKHGEHIRACLRGLWDGFTGRLNARY